MLGPRALGSTPSRQSLSVGSDHKMSLSSRPTPRVARMSTWAGMKKVVGVVNEVGVVSVVSVVSEVSVVRVVRVVGVGRPWRGVAAL